MKKAIQLLIHSRIPDDPTEETKVSKIFPKKSKFQNIETYQKHPTPVTKNQTRNLQKDKVI